MSASTACSISQGDITFSLSEVQWALLSEGERLLRPFMHLQKFLEGEQYVTISWIPYFLSRVRCHLQKAVADADSDLTDMSHLMLTQFNQRFGDGSVSQIPVKIALAAALDPRTKQLVGMTDSDKQKVWDEVKAALREMKPASVSTTTETACVLDNDDDSQDMFAGAQAAVSSTPVSLSDTDAYCRHIDSAVLDWQNAPVLAHSAKRPANPLSWFAEHHLEHPLIAELAKRVLCIPATSASSERLFSLAGLTVTAKRNALTDENAGRLIFLRGSWETAAGEKAAAHKPTPSTGTTDTSTSDRRSQPMSTADKQAALRTKAAGLVEGSTASSWRSGGTGRGSGVPKKAGMFRLQRLCT